jgi:predicted nucleic-acid-binding Zn-ribbon protein
MPDVLKHNMMKIVNSILYYLLIYFVINAVRVLPFGIIQIENIIWEKEINKRYILRGMKVKKEKCPECGSTSLYQEVSLIARKRVNGKKEVYKIDKYNIDNVFQPYYCSKCGWNDLDKQWKKNGCREW